MQASSPKRRPADRAVLADARRYIPLPEVGKAAFLQTIDVARFAARHLGEDLRSAGLLDTVEDVFHSPWKSCKRAPGPTTARS